MNDLASEIAAALNRFSAENASNTPDWILAQFLLGCLKAWNENIQKRESWYGRNPGQTNEPIAPMTEDFS